ncbi:MAG: hypothetical protein WCD30_17345, partial [Pseudolabrys sp.]
LEDAARRFAPPVDTGQSIQSIAVNRYSHPLRACPWVNEAPKFVTVPCQVVHPLTFCQVPRRTLRSAADNLSAHATHRGQH